MATSAGAPPSVADGGLTILNDPQDATIDIVFVHGLQGHPKDTWTYKSKPSRSPFEHGQSPEETSGRDQTRPHKFLRTLSKRVPRHSEEVNVVQEGDNGGIDGGKELFWPGDLLTPDFPMARVMTFGYNTNITAGYRAANQGNIFSHARDLLYRLEARRRRKAVDRDLLFIAHSLGGILVKEVLRRSETDPDPKINKVFASTVGVFFFGTPHRGSKEWASFGEGIAGVAGRLLGVDTNKEVIHALLPSAPELELCRESFVTQWVKRGNTLTVRTFQEAKGVTGVRWGGFNQRIVPPDSSTLDHPNQRARTIDSDHMNMVKFDGKNCEGYQMVREDIEELLENIQVPPQTSNISVETRNVHWVVPRAVNTLFTGRSELLERVQSAFRKQSSGLREQRRFVVTGMGGQGKSEFCLKIANMMREDFWGVFWVDVSSTAAAKNGFTAIAKALGLSTESINDSLQALAHTKSGWLLILDNADDLNYDYQAYFPSGNQGSVIMTSRIPDCSGYSTIKAEALEGLHAEQSTQLLLKAARIPEEAWSAHENQALEVVSLLGSHTLALIQAGAYIAEGHCQLSQYHEKYQRQRTRLLKHYPGQEQSRYRDVYATFEASADVLEHCEGETGKDALDLLGVLSMLHFSKLPIRFFEDAWWVSKQVKGKEQNEDDEMYELRPLHVHQLPEFSREQTAEWDDYRLTRAVSRLTSLSLVTRHRSDNDNALSMHPLAHAWAKDRLDKEQQEKAWVSAGCLLALVAWQSEWRAYENVLRPHVQSYLLPNVKAMLSYGSQEMMLPIILRCGWILHFMIEDARLRELLHDVYQQLRITPSKPSKEHLLLWDLAARNLTHLGSSRQAVELLEYIAQARETLAETDPKRLTLQHELALAYLNNGQIEQAVKLLENVVKVEETTLAGTHPSRLASQHTLAHAYLDNGQIEQAVKLLKHVVKVRETTLAGTHPSRLASQHQLARAYFAIGQRRQAVELIKRVVEIRKTTLPETHPNRQRSERVFAWMLSSIASKQAATENGQ